MPFNSLTDRTDVSSLIPEQVASEVIDLVTEQSVALTQFRKVTMSRKQYRMPVLSTLPQAYFVDGDTGLKQTSEASWGNKFITAEEIAVIVPVPENVLDDSDFDIWGEMKPHLAEAIARTFDSAVFFGINAPGTFPQNVRAASAAAGNVVTSNTAANAGGFLADLDNLIGTVEADGYDPSGIIAARSVRGSLRSARNAQGDRIAGVSPGLDEYDGVGISYPMRGLWPTGAAGANVLAFAGDWSQFVAGVRKDITYEVFKEGVISDADGKVILNLMQQDSVALRVTFRGGWQVANGVRHEGTGGYSAATLVK